MNGPDGLDRDWRGMACGWLAGLAASLRFLSRLPIPALPFEGDIHGAPDFQRLAALLPVAGAILGAIGAAALALCLTMGLPPTPSAILAVAALAFSTGAFHEDGLADTLDGMGGGATRARKLEIMKDSRIGTYGAAGLTLALFLRVSLIVALLDRHGLAAACATLIAAGALSRTAAAWLAYRLPAARAEGAAFTAGAPGDPAFWTGVCLAVLLTAALLAPVAGVGAPLGAIAAAMFTALAMERAASRQLGGQTGDVAGATQQFADLGVLIITLLLAR